MFAYSKTFFLVLQVHYNGFVTFDSTTRRSLGDNICPQGLATKNDFVAPYWLKYFNGSVHAFLLNNNDDKQRIVQDLREADLLDATDPGEVTIFVITWLRMRTSGDKPNVADNKYKVIHAFIRNSNDEIHIFYKKHHISFI